MVEQIDADNDKLVGANIQKLRTAKGMSQADLAAALTTLGGVHMHQQTIQKIEKGTRPLKYMEAVTIAEVLTVDVHALSAGQTETVHAAANLKRLEDIFRMTEELDDVAKRLAYQLVMLAVRLGIDQKNQAEDETRTPADESAGWLERRIVDTLERNWGRELNEGIHLAMQQHPYLAEVKSEFAAPTYGEVLKRVSGSPIIWPVLDATEA